jgi:hypothetical protein
MRRRTLLACSALPLALCGTAPSQALPRDDLWVARPGFGTQPFRVDRFGFDVPIQAPLPNATAFRRAPNGEVWILLAPVLRQLGVTGPEGRGTRVLTVPAEPRDLVVDAQGHAWVTLVGGQVQEFLPPGQQGSSFLLPGTGRGAAVDETGRLWFGVENQPTALLSWRDPGSTVSNVSLPASLGRVVDLAADGRPGGSHVYIAGDAGGEIVEADRQGVARVVGAVGNGPTARVLCLEVAPDGSLRVGADDGLWELDPVTGAARLLAGGVATSLGFDTKGALWATLDSGLVRLDGATGAFDFQIASANPMSCDDGSAYRLARVVLPRADFDGDGVANRAEIDLGTNPLDPQSAPALEVRTAAVQVRAGSEAELVARGDLGWGFVLFGTGPAVVPTPIPGVLGDLLLANPVSATLPMPVPGELSIRVPPAPAALGPVHMQVLRLPVGAAAPRLGERFVVRPAVPARRAIVERFDSVRQFDAERSAGTWMQGVARPAPLGGIGRLGSFDPTLGRQVAPGVYEFDAVGQVFPASATLFGRPETVTDGLFEFTDFEVPAGVTVRFVGDRPAIVRVRGRARIAGLVDVGGADVPGGFDARSPAQPVGNPPLGRAGQPGSRGGAGAGAGGAGADACLGLGPTGGRFVGDPGADLLVPRLSGYLGQVAGSGGGGGPLWPALGRSNSVAFNLFFTICGQAAAGGGGGGYLAAGGAGRVVQLFTGIPSDASPDSIPGGAVTFRLAPGGVDALDHYLVGGAGGGGGGSHPLNMTRTQISGTMANAAEAWRAGAGGAGGGGALGLRVGGDLEVLVGGGLFARGGSAAAYLDANLGPPSPGGGGSGGTVLLQVGGSVWQAGVIDVAGGAGGHARNVQFNGQSVDIVGGDGAPGYVRLERPTAPTIADLGQVVGPAVLTADNLGALRDTDPWTGQLSKWYATGSPFAVLWEHYVLRALVDGTAVRYSDDPTAFQPATGPGAPVQLWVQGARLDATGQVAGAPGPWRPFVRDLSLDGANALRFMLLFDRSAARDVAVDELTVDWR